MNVRSGGDHYSARVCLVSVVPQLRHAKVRVVGPLALSKMLGTTRARPINFPHRGHAGA
jgi:hypothetical protein